MSERARGAVRRLRRPIVLGRAPGACAALAVAAVAVGLTTAAPASAAFTLRVTGTPAAPKMVFGGHVSAVSVCLPVTNPAGGTSVLYGQRFTDGPVTSSTPAIVLVHGIASSTEDWDFSPTWSVARALASAGYVVFSYDRLGYAKSSYFSQPEGGLSLTTEAHRMMLHEVLGDVKSGSYQIAGGASCASGTKPGTTTSRSVVIIGHSAGGWVVAGYPGEYHDVAAMIETDISGSAGGSASSPLGGSSGGSFTPDPAHLDYFEFFQTTQECLDFNTYTPGVVEYVAKIACTPPFLDSPYGEVADLPAMYAQNDAYISMIGPTIPVLLTSGENDTTDPPSSAQADFAYYKDHCGCNVSQILLPDTAHLFMAHRSLATWVDDVVNWLNTHGLHGNPAPLPPPPPAVTGARVSHTRFRPVPVPKAVAAARRHRRRPPAGTSFRFTLSQQADVTIAIARLLPGRMRGARCVKPTRRLRRAGAPTCTRPRRAVVLRAAGRSRGADAVGFGGRVGVRALATGIYAAVLVASNAHGRSQPVTLHFRIVR